MVMVVGTLYSGAVFAQPKMLYLRASVAAYIYGKYVWLQLPTGWVPRLHVFTRIAVVPTK